MSGVRHSSTGNGPAAGFSEYPEAPSCWRSASCSPSLIFPFANHWAMPGGAAGVLGGNAMENSQSHDGRNIH
ncbi:hypothetical protein [Citrobacter sp. JGM124]|uniref:hypothetical protein n=1 Tax=Citrobacter sp. JGM124 TaxID=2799789 RepID=UPI001BAC9E9A|nr:hypothetical protein [Citrobacter sp. JGM124]MBS0847572.1 hypothetical protein [Citrobacter sp. JGM124]